LGCDKKRRVSKRGAERARSKGEKQGSRIKGREGFDKLDALGCAHVEVCADEC